MNLQKQIDIVKAYRKLNQLLNTCTLMNKTPVEILSVLSGFEKHCPQTAKLLREYIVRIENDDCVLIEVGVGLLAEIESDILSAEGFKEQVRCKRFHPPEPPQLALH